MGTDSREMLGVIGVGTDSREMHGVTGVEADGREMLGVIGVGADGREMLGVIGVGEVLTRHFVVDVLRVQHVDLVVLHHNPHPETHQ